jgi:hypothetical protein
MEKNRNSKLNRTIQVGVRFFFFKLLPTPYKIDFKLLPGILKNAVTLLPGILKSAVTLLVGVNRSHFFDRFLKNPYKSMT